MDFNPIGHQYSKGGKPYISVSEFLDRFEKPFAKGLMAERTAQKLGCSAQEVIDKWDLNAAISRDYGNAVHQAIEYWIRFGEFVKASYLKKVVEAFAAKHPDRASLEPEITASNDDYMLAGTMDQLEFIDRAKKRVGILDVKTNGDLEKEAYGNFLAPIDKLPCSKINRYRLQLSTYKHLLELKGFKVEYLKLEHLDGDKFKTIELEPIDVAPLCQTLVGGSGINIHSKKIVKI